MRGQPRAAWPAYIALTVLLIPIFGCGGEEKKPLTPGAKLDNLLKTGKLDEAERLLRELVKKEDSKKEESRTQLHRGNLVRVLCLRGEAALTEAGFFDPDPEKAKKAQKHRSYAEAQGYFTSAASEARLVFKGLPAKKHWRFAKVRASLGLALYRLGRMKDAIKELERAVADDNKVAAAHNTLGIIYHETGERKTALAHFNAALLADPGLSDAAYNLGVYYQDEVEALVKSEVDARRAGSKMPKGSAERKAAARKDAVKYYKRYIEDRTGDAQKRREVREKIKKLKAGAAAAPKDAPRPA